MKVVNLKDYPRDRAHYIGRGSRLGNPFTHLPLAQTKALVQCDTVESAVGCYEAWLRGSTAWDDVIPHGVRTRALAALAELHENELLGCYCQDLAKCRGQVIVKLWKEQQSAR
jgi:hypothetical protein